MPKIFKQVKFTYDFKKEVVREMKIVTETFPVTVEGVAEKDDYKYGFDIESIKDKYGNELFELFQFLDYYENDIHGYAMKFIPELFMQLPTVPEPEDDVFKKMADIVADDVKRRYGIDVYNK